MKTILALCCFCCFALVQKVAAQVAATDTASATQAAKPDPRADRLRAMSAMRDRRRDFRFMSAPFPGEVARHARFDARQFKLAKNLIPKVRSGEITATSDYFKPTEASTPTVALLADSAYVKDYRFYAYNRGSRQLIDPLGTGLIIGGSILLVVYGIVALFVALGHIHIQPHMY